MDRLDNQLHQLHQEGLLILTNVADAAGARLVEQLGNKAVAVSYTHLTLPTNREV